MNRFFRTPLWKIFVGPKHKNLRYLFLIFIPYLLTAILEGGSFSFIFMAFSVLDEKIQNVNLPQFLSFLEFKDQGWSTMQLFYFYIFAAIFFQAIRGLTSFFALYGTSLLALKTQTILQKKIYQQIFRFSFPFVSQYKMGDLSDHAKNPSTFIPTIFTGMNQFFVSTFMCLGLVSVLYWLSPILSLCTFVLFFLFIFFQKTIIKKVIQFSNQLTDHLVEFSHQTVQSLQGIRLIHAFHRQKYILKKINSTLNQVATSSKKAHFWNNLIPPFNETINVLLVGSILVLGTFLLTKSNHSTVASLLTYIALTYRMGTRIQTALAALGSVSMCSGPILRLNKILSEKDKIYSPKGGITFNTCVESIEFRDVFFQYPKAKNPILSKISFSIPKGTTTAIVGLSGAGKSSILDLILALQKPTNGKILINSEPLELFSHESWRQKIGVVHQDTFILNETIEENIRFGDLSATQEDIEKALKLAGAFEFIQHLPKERSTILGERGHKLSGGERQRIAFARALLKKPEILILDEATSNLDSFSEQLIQDSLSAMNQTKTIIIVAHRLSTITQSDQIIVLQKGQIIESGKHEQLLVMNGLYAQLWKLQSN